MRKRLIAAVCAVVVALAAFWALTRQPAIAPIEPPAPSSFAKEQVEHGAVLASAGNCAACHTAKGGTPYAGNRPIDTPFGTVYSTNITPDRDTGIGDWSLAAFTRAMRQGIARDGRQLFLAFPYDHFTKLTEADIASLYSFLMSQPATRAEAPANTLPFPLDIRALQAVWKATFVRQGIFEQEAGKSAEWNRGAYLAEALAHCGACHTMRNVFGAEQRGHPYGGAPVEGWAAWPLDVSPSPARWTREEFFTYLRGGTTIHGRALGPMEPVVRALGPLPDSDIAAIATYFADLNRPQSATPEATTRLTLERAHNDPAGEKDTYGERIYVSACSSCHGGLTSKSTTSAELALSTSLWSDRPQNFFLTVLDGTGPAPDGSAPAMPPFRDKLTSAQIISLENYLRHTWLHEPGWPYTPIAIDRLREDPTALLWFR